MAVAYIGNKKIYSIQPGGGGGGAETHTVYWYDYDGTVLKEDVVEDGGTSIAPTVPSHQHLTFREWVHGDTITNVKQDYFNIARHAYLGDELILKVNVGESQDYTLTIGVYKASNSDPVVFNWGDGTTETHTVSNRNAFMTHTYATSYTGYVLVYSSSGAVVSTLSNNATYRDVGVEEYYFGAKTALQKTAGIGRFNQYLKAVVFPDQMTVMPDDFFSMWMPKVLAYPATLTTFGITYGTLHIDRGNTPERLEAVNIPSNVTEIKSYVFVDCSSLKFITKDINVTSIPIQAFLNCTSLRGELNVNGIVTAIGNEAFKNCNLRKISIPNGTITTFSSTSVFESCSELEEVTLPSTITSLAYNIFKNCSKLKTISFSNLTSIGNQAFYGCTSLEAAEIDGTYTTVGTELFRNCTSLKSVKLANSLTTLNNEMFNGCASLESITFPSSLTAINNGAMTGLKSITSVTVPDTITTLGTYFLNSAGAMKSLHIGLNMPIGGSNFLNGCVSVEEIDCSNGWIPSSQFTFTYPNVTASSWETFFTHLGDNSGNSAITLKIGTDNLNKLSTAQKEIATNKNYTVIA